MNLDNTVANLLSTADPAVVASVSADAGFGFDGEWPKPGVHIVQVLDIRVSAETFKRGRNDTGIPCVTFALQYREAAPAVGPDGIKKSPITFWGRPIDWVVGAIPNGTDEKVVNMINRDRQRGKGHLSKILNVAPEQVADLRAALEGVINRVKDEKALLLKVYTEDYAPEGSTRVYHTDYVRENLSVLPAPGANPAT